MKGGKKNIKKEGLFPKILIELIHFRAVTDAFVYNQAELFALFLDYLEPEQLQLTREYIDRIYDRKKSEASRKQLRILLRRQQTLA